MNRAITLITGGRASRLTRLLFGAPGCWPSRHPGAMLAVVILLALSADWIADTVATIVVGAL
jgi:hypothetical protein